MTTYGLVMIVRNEAINIQRCLTSAIAAGVTVATIVDTGSSDGTIAEIERYHYALDLRLSESSFVNMGHNRSEAFALARGSADWLLALDADMTVEREADFQPDPAIEAYQVEMRDGQWSWRLPLLLRGDLPWSSIGAYDEYTALPDRAFVGAITDTVRVHFPSVPTSVEKRHWQAGLLETYLAEHPDDERTLFYLAQKYRELGDPRARDLYLRRATMGGHPGEVFWSLYWAATLTDWPTRAVELMAAWEYQPHHLEPLRDLVRELNNRGSHRAAYALACAAQMTLPDDLGFVDMTVWAWGMTFERSIAAWYCGHPEETAALSDELLARDDLPADVRAAVERNLALCSPAVAA